MIDLVTSMNKKLYDTYGKHNLKTFNQNLSDELRLNIFFEGEIPEDFDFNSNKIIFHKFSSKEWDIFYNKFGFLQEANGMKFTRSYKEDNSFTLSIRGPDYRWEAVKFSFKIFSVRLASLLPEISNNFCWIDADTICLKKITPENLSEFMPRKNELMTFIGRDKYPEDFPHMEAGFLGFNRTHPQFDKFMTTLVSMYMTGDIFMYEQWHDSFLWDRAVDIFTIMDVKFRCLSGEYKSYEHPFVYTRLGELFDHLKGPDRKEQGYSSERFDNKIATAAQ